MTPEATVRRHFPSARVRQGERRGHPIYMVGVWFAGSGRPGSGHMAWTTWHGTVERAWEAALRFCVPRKEGCP